MKNFLRAIGTRKALVYRWDKRSRLLAGKFEVVQVMP